MGRPRVYVERSYQDFPAPTPQPTWCRLWQGAVDKDGYGVLSDPTPTKGNSGKSDKSYAHRKVYAHRWVWEMANVWKLPPHIVVRHKCDNRLCFRLSHLELGTVADNNRDAAERGHAGPLLVLSPAEINLLFWLRESGWTYRQIHERLDNVSYPTITRIGRLGREQFNDLWGLEIPPPPPKPAEKYAAWRQRGIPS